MSRPVFSFRPTLEDPEHKRAWEILQSVPGRQKNAFLVQAILQSEDRGKMEDAIRQIVREEIWTAHFVPKDTADKTADGIPVQMLDFLSSMEES